MHSQVATAKQPTSQPATVHLRGDDDEDDGRWGRIPRSPLAAVHEADKQNIGGIRGRGGAHRELFAKASSVPASVGC